MANRSGDKYGLNLLCPVRRTRDAGAAASRLRDVLAALPNYPLAASPLARVPGLHFARLFVLEDVVYEGHPAGEDHLQSEYLVFAADFDGELDGFIDAMRVAIPGEIEAVWRNCVGYPGLEDAGAWRDYVRRCQVDTTLYFADVPGASLEQCRRALRLRQELAVFLAEQQGREPADVQRAFLEFVARQRGLDLPAAPPSPDRLGGGGE